MSWQPLATIQISDDWTLTESVTGSIFRLNHNISGANVQSVRAVVAQAFAENNTNTYFDFRRITYKSEVEGFIFIQPAGLLNRTLAVKRLDNLTDDWTIAIEVLDGMPESISLPIELSEVSGLLEQLEARVSRLEFLDHIADTDNPHNVTAAQIGAERPGAAAAAAADAITSHKLEEDPHSQYATDANLGLVQTAINGKETVGVAAGLIANLTAIQIPLILPTATIIDYEGTIAANGILNANGLIWLLLDGSTIGNAASGATRYADSKALTLFQRLWLNSNLAIQTNTGSNTTRGATADADFDASKRLALPDARGRVTIAAGTGAGLTARTRGQTGGAETHILTNAQNAPHDHATPGGIRKFQVGGTSPWVMDAGSNSATESWNTLSSGGGQPHNIMQPYYVTAGKLILVGKA